MKCTNQDKFPGKVVEIFVAATNHVLSTLKFAAWDEATMKRQWRGRSLQALSENPEVNYLFPCLDTALLATAYLTSQGEEAYLEVLTEKGATKAFKSEKARIMHIDSLVRIELEGRPYLLDIGCGDVTLLTPVDEETREEVRYYTTRHNKGEEIWTRTPFLRVDGEIIQDNQNNAPLDFLTSKHNLVRAPFIIRKTDFYRENQVD